MLHCCLVITCLLYITFLVVFIFFAFHFFPFPQLVSFSVLFLSLFCSFFCIIIYSPKQFSILPLFFLITFSLLSGPEFEYVGALFGNTRGDRLLASWPSRRWFEAIRYQFSPQRFDTQPLSHLAVRQLWGCTDTSAGLTVLWSSIPSVIKEQELYINCITCKLPDPNFTFRLKSPQPCVSSNVLTVTIHWTLSILLGCQQNILNH